MSAHHARGRAPNWADTSDLSSATKTSGANPSTAPEATPAPAVPEQVRPTSSPMRRRLAKDHMVPALGARRRIRSLYASGYDPAQHQRELGTPHMTRHSRQHARRQRITNAFIIGALLGSLAVIAIWTLIEVTP